MRLCFSGYFGARNAGDEAILAGALRGFALRGLSDLSRFTVLSADPRWTTELHKVPAVPRTDLGSIRRALRQCDLLISGGGSLFQDVTSLRSVLYYAGVLWLARRLGVPYVIFAQGVGPLRRRVSRSIVRRVFTRARQIMVRDRLSAELLARLGVPPESIEITADMAFALEPVTPEARDQARRKHEIDSRKPVVALCFRPWPGGQAPEMNLVQLCASLCLHGFQVVSVPMQPGDLDVTSAVGNGTPQAVLAPDGDPFRALEMLSACDVVVGMRLHGLILGILAGCVPVAVAYDPKVSAFMESLRLSENCLEGPLSVQSLVACADYAWEQRTARIKALQELLPALRTAALRNVDIALSAAT